MENHHFLWVNQLQMAIFNSDVSLPEGKYLISSAKISRPVKKKNNGTSQVPSIPEGFQQRVGLQDLCSNGFPSGGSPVVTIGLLSHGPMTLDDTPGGF